jgi:sulfite reductase (NADPH) flavoprotein alpha-component
MKAPTVTSPLEQVTHLASHHSSLLAVFDTAKLAGFPSPSPALLSYESAKVWSLQSRLGAGSSLAGYIRSADAHLTKPTTALISTPTLPLHLPALHELPEVTTRGNRLVIHLSVSLPPADRPLDAPSASLAQITPLLPLLPESFAVVFSSTPEDIIRNTAAVYEDAAFSRSNVLHVVEGVFAGRELVKKETLSSPAVLDTFTYSGSADATKVIVLPASYSSALLRSTTLPSAGVLTINVLGPWPTNSFMDALPNGGKDVQELVVVEESESEDGTDVLKEMVVGAVFGRAGTSGGKVPKITGALIKGGETSLGSLLLSVGVPFQLPTKKSVVKQSLFLTSTESLLPHLLTKTFLSSPSLKTRLSTLTSTIPSLNQSTLLIAPSNASSAKSPFTSYPAASSSSLIFVSQAAALTQTRSAFASLAQNGTILISLPGWDHSTVAENLSPADRKTLKSKNARLFVLPPTSKDVSEAEETALGLVGFFLLYAGIGQGGKLPESVRALVESSLGHLGEFIGRAEENLTEINVSTLTTTAEEDEQEEKRSDLSLDALPSFPSAAPSSSASSSDTSKPFTASWHSPALHLLFKESFAPNASAPLKSHTPASHDKTYLATVTENRRLTPVTYDRNVFHLELSTAGTGLKYDVGEALGVHGWNDEQETREFLEWYGVSPNTIISIPIEGGKKVETRTALQIFQQRVDIFGRPGKAFYAALVGKTKNREEARQLRFISSAEGSPMFKKWSENETVTFVDVLQRFPGLKENVSIEELVELVGEVSSLFLPLSDLLFFFWNVD